MNRTTETICAPASGTGGAISVIRISGPVSLDISSRILFVSGRPVSLADRKANTVIYGEIRSDNETIDDVLLTVFKAPHSYTGEDSAEISCHASPYIIRKILELLIKNGAKAAFPGEFTRRAFLNGKMDLSQAEAVADLIASGTAASHRIAMNQMKGGFSEEIKKLRAELLHFASLIELELDFGEEDVEFADRAELKQIVTSVKQMSDRLAASFSAGNALKNGIPVVITGKPNSGKSTLLNALLMEERALVSDIPGTTRDSIEDSITIEGLEFRFIDTAGLRETSDIVESMGISRTREKIRQASIILFIDEINDDARSINQRADSIRKMISDYQKLIILVNKSDQAQPGFRQALSENIKLNTSEYLLFISAREKTGLEELKQKLSELSFREKLDSDEVIISNIRHFEALTHVSESLDRVISGLDSSIPEDLIATDIRQAIHYLGEITGEITSDEILGNIF
ncbi:MAG TPA: tRNA uridine-5-carboxymethylaminomethyl(34) synthesis GTPase MnmE, partial [Bacteroidales bacterium]|nr:tRNA uridine-5-carboxymethylaminomethyl(34) synthesis GTPase MnmE [Bacteroidales bacterium]